MKIAYIPCGCEDVAYTAVSELSDGDRIFINGEVVTIIVDENGIYDGEYNPIDPESIQQEPPVPVTVLVETCSQGFSIYLNGRFECCLRWRGEVNEEQYRNMASDLLAYYGMEDKHHDIIVKETETDIVKDYWREGFRHRRAAVRATGVVTAV